MVFDRWNWEEAEFSLTELAESFPGPFVGLTAWPAFGTVVAKAVMALGGPTYVVYVLGPRPQQGVYVRGQIEGVVGSESPELVVTGEETNHRGRLTLRARAGGLAVTAQAKDFEPGGLDEFRRRLQVLRP